MLECKESHPACSDNETSVPLPTRLIDVEALTVHHTAPGDIGKYAALSYCWGVPLARMRGALFENNVETLKKNVRIHNLPPTVRDAILMTQRLRLRYLWVDAYCIIQDNDEDMNKELAQMGEIYGRAHITLSASSAVSVEDGFLQLRKPPDFKGIFSWSVKRPDGSFKPFPRLCLDYGGIGTVIVARPILVDYQRLQPEPIEQRAWTFQEKLLSPRVLIFAKNQLKWQCNGIDKSMSGESHYKSDTRPEFFKSAEDRKRKSLGQLWQQIVTQYSGRQLSSEQDRLVALSAVASK